MLLAVVVVVVVVVVDVAVAVVAVVVVFVPVAVVIVADVVVVVKEQPPPKSWFAVITVFNKSGEDLQLSNFNALEKNGPVPQTTCVSEVPKYLLMALLNASAFSSHASSFPMTSK